MSVCHVRMYDMYECELRVHVCYVSLLFTYDKCARYDCFVFMFCLPVRMLWHAMCVCYVTYVCYFSVLRMSAMYVCYVCMLCMRATYVC